MRILGGLAKGRNLKSPLSFSTRPLLARVKKSLFDILSIRLQDASFLDLYAGVGSVGIEALSRGSKKAVFIDKDIQCVDLIKQNLIKCGLMEKALVYRGDVLTGLSYLIPHEKFDVIFVGPPYLQNLLEKSIKTVITLELLNTNAVLIGQHHCKESMPEKIENLEIFRQEKYGEMRLSFYRHIV